MIVVVDTNIFHGDPRMRRANFRILLGQHARGRLSLALPEVVVREVPKLFATQLDAASTAINVEATKLRDLGHDPGKITGAVTAERERDLQEICGKTSGAQASPGSKRSISVL